MPRPKLLSLRSGRAELRYETAALTKEEAAEFAALAERGIAAVERLAATSAAPRGRHGRTPLRFEISTDGRISSARGRTIHLSAHRVRTRCAPYLHEIAHVLVPCTHAPEWFSEGLACYLESAVSESGAGYDSHLFSSGGNATIHEDARQWLAEPRGRAVLPYAGRRGMPRRILEDRQNVAAPFYALSHSLVKFLADHAGVATVIAIARATHFSREFKRLTGKSPATLRQDWLNHCSPPL